jgi:uncharacterized protein YbcC (UPF0753/DUF2309 family)
MTDPTPRAAIECAIATACARIAPLWPLTHFVAVNPFLGFSGMTFADTAATLARIAGARMLMPRAFYRARIDDGTISDADLAAARAASPHQSLLPHDLPGLRRAAAGDAPQSRPPAMVATVAEVLDRLAGGDRHAARTAFMIDEISKFCAAYFDQGQAAWKLPWRDAKPYAAWRAAMRHDRNPEAMGIRGFRAAVAALPDEPTTAIAHVVDALALPAAAVPDYLTRALFDIQGWAAFARYRAWQKGLDGEPDDTLAELLAIRLAWGFALFQERTDTAFRAAWQAAMDDAARSVGGGQAAADPELALDLVLHGAFELAFQRGLLERLAAHIARPPRRTPARPAVQAAFCIDVRSEIFRRALEASGDGIETIGFAGFFGFPIEYVPLGAARGTAQCPVLLKPSAMVCEQVEAAAAGEEKRVLALRLVRRRAARAWKAFRQSAVSSFTYVETLGLAHGARLIGNSFGLTRPVADPRRDGLDAGVVARLGPRITPGLLGGRASGFEPEPRVAMAEAVLRAMSMTGPFARLVLLAGHGSSTVNNPHATGLDCGACGGHTGEANARVAAALLNDRAVRAGLAARGIEVPDDTWFVPALHDTTTDEVRLFDTAGLPESHAADLASLRAKLAGAGARARAERAQLLGIAPGAGLDRAVASRARDWSQVRPEWGLAGNAAFIAAPRARTEGLPLAGRSFLHSYDWTQDRGFGVLELIMTAPMVVASWINLQYFGSTVNNQAFGSGDKTLHNVVGALGVLEGNAGDLRTGLPWQSVHDGRRFVHEPLRLNVFIEAPREAITGVIAKHSGVRDLLDNGWVHLFAIGADGKIARHAGAMGWQPACGAPLPAAA